MPNQSRDKINRRVLRDLKTRSTPGIAFYVLLAVLILVSDDFYHRQSNFSLAFFSSILGICLFRLIHLPIYRLTDATHEKLNRTIFFVSVVLTAMIWGVFFVRFMTLDGEHTAKLVMAVCTAGLSAGGVVAFVPNLGLSVVFNFSMLVPTIAVMIVRQINLPIALSILLFSIYLVMMALRANREYWQALENERLLMEKTEELHTLSRIDGLTGLYNRRHFDERLDHEWKKAKRVQRPPTLLLCDIDHFKQINDQYGHQAGDEFLKLTAILLRTVFKRDTDLVARYGGEEFIVLMTDIDPDTAYGLAEEMRRRMAEVLMPYKGHNISATMSIGVAGNTSANETRESLISRADNALYQAKRKGRNRTEMDRSGSPR
ncbi:GGDEF domain-containing protein [uncultured Desulfosarcina sp.]|uniref:GGDEF domain-containing protein n=1 Tax=uncultured Desulfosarcina sp. TaxID=218289 RepID=UPI0029C76559|nr:GGDEF domain-containing protein [uncultured Desulfosarcina sp.]